MRTEIDLDAAAEAGLIDEDLAIRLRTFQAQQDRTPAATAEKFQLFGGYADLVSAVGLALVFAALFATAMGDGPQSPLLALILLPMPFVAFLIGKRIDMRVYPAVATVLMVAFLWSGYMTLPVLLNLVDLWPSSTGFGPLAMFIAGALAASVIYWRAFRFPPTLAAAVIGIGFVAIQVTAEVFRDSNLLAAGLALLIACGTLVAAIWWDMTDIRRETERSQVAFWLHCCAGLLLTRALFSLLTGEKIMDGELVLTGIELAHLPWLILMIAVTAVLSLLLDRRSLLTGTLLPIVGIFGSGREEAAAGMIIAGFGLLFFNWSWTRLRRALLAVLPLSIEAQLPRTGLGAWGQRPTRRHLPLRPSRAARDTDSA